jgi:hypothetical protein
MSPVQPPLQQKMMGGGVVERQKIELQTFVPNPDLVQSPEQTKMLMEQQKIQL